MPFAKMTRLAFKPLLSLLLVLMPLSSPALAQMADDPVLRKMTRLFFKSHERNASAGLLNWRDQQSPNRTALENLARRLLAAGSDAERQSLLDEAPSLVSTELARELNLLGFANLNSDLRDSAYIVNAHRLAHEIATRSGDTKRAGDSLVNLCHARIEQGQYQQAMDNCRQALSWCRANGYQTGVANSLDRIAAIHDARGDYAGALRLYEDSLKILEEAEEPTGIARSLNQLGRWHYGQGNHDQALELYQRAVRLREEIASKNAGNLDNQNSLTLLYANIGLVQTDLGNYAEALAQFEKSVVILRALGRDTGVVLGQIGAVYKRQANYALALQYYKTSLAARERRGNPLFLFPAYINLGEIYQVEGEYAQALDYYRQALALGERLENQRLMCKAHRYLGSVLHAQNDDAQALAHLHKSMALCDPVNDRAELTEANHQTALIHLDRQDFDRASPFIERAYALSMQMDYSELRWRVPATAGRLYLALNQPARAQQALLDSISSVEQMRSNVAGDETQSQAFFENKTVPYLALAGLLAARKELPEAINYAERAKARALLDVLRSGRFNPSKAMTAAERTQERKLTGEIVSLNTRLYRERASAQPDQTREAELTAQLNKARRDYEGFRALLYVAHPELKVLRGEANSLTLDEAASLLPDEKTAFLNYVVTPERVHLFVLTRAKDGAARLRFYPLAIKREALTARVEQFRGQLAGRDARFGKLARELYALLLKPAQVDLPPQARLMIVPDGPLWELPFQALLTGQQRFLWEDHVIAYAPSLTVLREMTKVKRGESTTRAVHSLFAVGDPALGGENIERLKSQMSAGTLSQLPEARTQVETLRKFYDANRSKVFTGEAAAEATVKSEAGKFDILHFAAHGVLNNRNPLYSYILLAQADAAQSSAPSKESPKEAKEDGLLEAWEVMQMDLHADLAVLSACETARGRVGAGEGMIGLTWALFVAGVPTTVVSQWSVRADKTADLMVEFHRQLQLRNAGSLPRPASEWTKAEALRLAALKLLRNGQSRHPFYWAGFVLIGQPR